ncbi:hypothetical protein K1719_021671 [Acacia pycnantha]|nr:hypothetical protein K1719_021671 [Acacia pycnantha]
MSNKEFQISTLSTFFVIIYLLGIITYGISILSGLFIPVILAGASYDRLISRLLSSVNILDPGMFALIGAASFLGGTMRMTVSICVILLELTNNLYILPLLMMVQLTSKTVGDIFNQGIYDQIMKLKGLPYLEAVAEPYMRHLTAGDVVSGPFFTFSGAEKVRVRELSYMMFILVRRRWKCTLISIQLLTLRLTLVKTMSLAKAALLFRELGLRHLLLVPKTTGKLPVVGILTRHDFMPARACFGTLPSLGPSQGFNSDL